MRNNWFAPGQIHHMEFWLRETRNEPYENFLKLCWIPIDTVIETCCSTTSFSVDAGSEFKSSFAGNQLGKSIMLCNKCVVV